VRGLPRVSAAAFITACCGIPVILTLWARVPNLIDRAFDPPRYGWTETPFEIPATTFTGSGQPYTLYRLAFRTGQAAALSRHDQIRLLMVTYDSNPAIESAELRIAGTTCVFASPPDAKIVANDLLALDAGRGCRPMQGTPTGRIALIIRSSNAARVGLWTYLTSTAAGTEPLTIDPDPQQRAGDVYLPIGRTVDVLPPTGHRRLDLLAYVWQIGGAAWIVGVLAICTALLFAGAVMLWASDPGQPRAAAAWPALGAASTAAALGILYAVLTPPFGAPDEPNHLRAFLTLEGRPQLTGDAARWGRVGHFRRIHYTPMERFRPSDIGGLDDEWDSGYAPDPTQRGSGGDAWWRVLARIARPLSIEREFRLLRVCNALLFAATLGTCAFLVGRLHSGSGGHLRFTGLFFIPTLPFWAMHVSNYAPMIACDVVMATGILLLLLDDEHPGTAALLAGGGWAAAVLVGRSAAPLAALLVALALGRCALGARDRAARDTWRFWTALAVPVAVAVAVSDPSYLETQAALLRRVAPGFTGRVAGWLLTRPLVAVPLAALAGAALETAVTWLRRDWGRDDAIRRAAAGLGWVAAAALVVVAVASIWLPYPHLPALDPLHLPVPRDYALQTVKTVLTMGRLAHPDYLTSTTFWGGFGWRGIEFPEWLTGLLAGGSALLAALLCGSLVLLRATRRILWLAFFLCGVTASAALYGLSAIAVTAGAAASVNLVGRYLLGLYISPIVIAWLPLAECARPERYPRLARWLPLAAGASSALLHGYCLSLVLRRYF
jgi:hypothetical protein